MPRLRTISELNRQAGETTTDPVPSPLLLSRVLLATNRQAGVTRRTELENDAFCRHRWVRVFGIAFCARCGMCPVREEMSSKA